MEKEIYLSIKYGDPAKLNDLGGGEQVDLNFKIEIEKDLFYYPIMLAAAIGEADCLKIMLKNTQLQIDVVDAKTGTNAFWIASFYGRGECMGLLANSGINILNTHKETKSNALHVAIERKHYDVAIMLIQSKFPLENEKLDGLTPLIISSRDNDAFNVSETLIKKGAYINKVSETGQSALSQAVFNNNQLLSEHLVKHGGLMFNEDL